MQDAAVAPEKRREEPDRPAPAATEADSARRQAQPAPILPSAEEHTDRDEEDDAEGATPHGALRQRQAAYGNGYLAAIGTREPDSREPRAPRGRRVEGREEDR